MAGERLPIPLGEVEPTEKDPNLFTSENGSILSDLIRFQLSPSKKVERIADGPFVLDNNLWFFRATNKVDASTFDPEWFYYKAMAPHEFSLMIKEKAYTDEQLERFRIVYPDVDQINATDTFRPELDDYLSLIEPALTQAVHERRKKLPR